MGDQGSDAQLLVISGSRMGDDSSHEDDGFPEQFRSMFRHQEGEVIILSSAALILRQMLDNIWAVVRMTFLDSLF